jgi:hypothetical protein
VQCGSRRSFLGYQACRQRCRCLNCRCWALPMMEASHRTCHVHQVRLCEILQLLCIADTDSYAYSGRHAALLAVPNSVVKVGLWYNVC